MLGVVDYGSSSEGSDMETNEDKPLRKGVLNLPPVVPKPKIKKKIVVGEDRVVQEKRDWEKKMAEQMDKDKEFVRKTVNENTKKKIVLPFAKVPNGSKAESDDEDVATKPKLPKPSFKSELLKILPQPKNPVKKAAPSSKAASVMLPSSITRKKPEKRPLEQEVLPVRTDIVEGYSDSDNEEDAEDFFGFNSKQAEVPSVPIVEEEQLSAPKARVYIDEQAPGPSFPAPDAETDYSMNADLEEKLLGRRNITDEEAQALIYQKELAPWGATDRGAREAVLNIVDVSVDQTLGPNVRETLLRNLDQKNAVATPLPQVKDSGDRMAKSKHQITHLAKVAVARETQLQQQWADSKAQKRQTRQKYGF
ncbi:unnamed protein product [Bursaphelenchus okinawaensis]|uniref:Proline-rich protein PRCC n=1 Tax=Bursaphelenchus okinawaensis TaxID=465554 RepID=A0A811KU10_9BILA|nr:unnamed protein product [Bursaphelenchus okinawaensis]CAG9111533.1 unnamed protein product [Bursaphelenchus okinawaensis]